MNSKEFMSEHNCLTCSEFDTCCIKEMVDYFRGKKLEHDRVFEIFRQKKDWLSKKESFLNGYLNNPDATIILCLMIGYAQAKKEDGVNNLEHISKV